MALELHEGYLVGSSGRVQFNDLVFAGVLAESLGETLESDFFAEVSDEEDTRDR